MLFEVNIHPFLIFAVKLIENYFCLIYTAFFFWCLKSSIPPFHAGFPKDLLRKSVYFVALKRQFTLIVKTLCSLKYDREVFYPVSTNSSISSCPVPLMWVFYMFLSYATSPILDMTRGLYGTEIECI